METTRIGVVGAGRWGPHLVRIFEENSRSRVTAIADSDPDRRTRIGELHPGVDVLASADDLLARPDLDAVVLATPSETHHRLAARALDRGLHTFVEKPLARSAAEAEDLVRRSERSGAVLFAGHVFLFNPAIRAARAQIAAGELGCIRYLQSIRTNLGPVRTDVSALWDLAPHDLSIFRHWLGADPVRATAKGGTYLNDGLEDVVFATLEYPGGVLANLVVTWLAPRKIRQITAVGDRRMLVFDDRSPDGAVLLYDRGVDAGDPGVTETISAFRSSIRDGERTRIEAGGEEPLAAECDHFLDCIRTGAAPIAGGTDGLAIIRALEAIERSMRNGSRETEVAR